MHILRVPYPKCFLVVSHKKAKALILHRLEKAGEIIETRIGYVVKAREVFRVHAFNVEAFVLKVDTLRVVPHAEPVSVGVVLDGTQRFLESGNIARRRSNVDVTDGVQPV